MGKNYSMGQKREKRNKADFYQTPYSLTRSLFFYEYFDLDKDVLEPACGAGAIADILKEKGFKNIFCMDIAKGIDFLKQDESKKYDYIITNPPYSLFLPFILKAKKIVNEKIAMLLPVSYLQGVERYNNLWANIDFPLKSMLVFNRYPMFEETIRKDGKFKTGMQTYAWFIWRKDYSGKPVIEWVDVNSHVVRKGE